MLDESPGREVSRGLDAVVDHGTRWADMWENWDLELEDVIDAGDDRVIVFFGSGGAARLGSTSTSDTRSCTA